MIPKSRVYTNNKPYITKEVKDCINRKKEAFKNNDHQQLKTVQKYAESEAEKHQETPQGGNRREPPGHELKKTMGLYKNGH